MTVWILALILLAGSATAGYAQGAIRALISFFGILISALLAFPLARLVALGLRPLGVEHPVLLYIFSPIVAFIAVLAVVKVAGQFAHKRVDVYYRYKAGDLRLSLYERLSQRVGACIGLLNGAAYTVLIAAVFLPMSYFSQQIYTHAEDGRMVRLLNAFGRDMQSTGFGKAVWRLDRTPAEYYRATDFLAFLYNNPLTHGRMALYPPFLRLGEKQEYSRLGEQDFAQLWLTKAQFGQIANDERSKGLWATADGFRSTWNLVGGDVDDLENFLRTGKSEKYDEQKALGVWRFDPNGSLVAFKKLKPNSTATQLKNMRMIYPFLAKAMLVISPDNRVQIKDVIDFGQGAMAMNATAAANRPGAPAASTPPVATAGGDSLGRLQDKRYQLGLSRKPGPGSLPPQVMTPAAPGQPAAPSLTPVTLDGEWQPHGSAYTFKFEKSQFEAEVDALRLTIGGGPFPLVFEKDVP